ncbi:hypothetical protein K491DRAFT_577557, partial [Lophiostoma macrostomum CBS 122681]
LPREIRDIIYEFYVAQENGYIFDADTGRFKGADRPIEMALLLMCKRVADEMEGMALRVNVLTFTTSSSRSLHSQAARFDEIMGRLHFVRAKRLDQMRDLIPPDLSKDLENRFPRSFTQQLCQTGLRCYNSSQGAWGEVESNHREFVRYALQQLSSTHPVEFSTAITEPIGYLCERHSEISYPGVLSSSTEPWAIPTDKELDCLEAICPPSAWLTQTDHRLDFRFSAAAVAIRFLESMTTCTRLHIRKIVLREDRKSSAFPACHGEGLIPFCIENPRLRVERRVDMWRAIFPPPLRLLERIWKLRDDPDEIDGVHELPIGDSVMHISEWVGETLVLASRSMPPSSYSLVFDSESAESTQEVFDTLKVEAQLLDAMTEHGKQDGSYTRHWKLQYPYVYYSHSLPTIVKEIIQGTSIIRFDALVGESWSWDLDQLKREWKGITFEEWETKRFPNRIEYLSTMPPMPKWIDIQLDYILP